MTVWLPHFSQILLSVKCSCRHAFLYIDIIYIYVYRHTHIYTPFLDFFSVCTLSPVPNELQLSFDVFSVWQVVSKLTLGKHLLMFEDDLLISELCWWLRSALVVNLLCSGSSWWVSLMVGEKRILSLDKSGIKDGLLDWQNERKELFRALWFLSAGM